MNNIYKLDKITSLQNINDFKMIVGEEKEKGFRQFFHFKSHSLFVDFYENVKEKHFYEYILKDRPVVPYMDLDIITDNKHDVLNIVYDISKQFESFMRERNLEISNCVISKSKLKHRNNEFKHSYHIVYPYAHFKNIQTLLFVIQLFISKCNKYEQYIDTSIYATNKSIRILYSSKVNEDRIKIPINDDNIFNHLVTNIKDNSSLLLFKIKEQPNVNKINIKYTQNFNVKYLEMLVNCLSIDRCNNYQDWIKVGFALHNIDNNIKHIWINWSKKSPKFSNDVCNLQWNYMKNVDNGLTIASIIYWAKLDNIDEYNKINFNLFVNQPVSIKEHNIYDTISTQFIEKCFFKDENGDAILFHKLYKNRIACTTGKNKQFYTWNGSIWELDVSNFTISLIINHLPNIYNKLKILWMSSLDNITDKNHINAINNKIKYFDKSIKYRHKFNHAKNVLELSLDLFFKDCPDFIDKLDSDPLILSVKNGNINLTNGEIYSRKPSDFNSFYIDINYHQHKYDLSIIDKFFYDIMLDDKHMVDYLQKILGYSITGLTKEHLFIIMHGSGSNGKSVLVELLSDTLQKYYETMDNSVIIASKKEQSSGKPSPHILTLKGKRIAILDESDKDKHISEAQIKLLSGGSKVSVRQLHSGDYISFKPTFQCILLTNHKPTISNDHALKRRLVLIPFNAKFTHNPTDNNDKLIDVDIISKLTNNKHLFLHWLINGAIKYFKYGLQYPPDIIKNATKQYFDDNDILSTFLSEKCSFDNNSFVSSTKLLEHFNSFANLNYSQQTLNQELAAKGYKQIRKNINNSSIRCFPFAILDDNPFHF